MSKGFIVVITLDGKFQDMGIFDSHEKAEHFRRRSLHEIEQLVDLGDPGSWEVVVGEIKERDISMSKDRTRREVELSLPDLQAQYDQMAESYREVGRWALYENRKEQVKKYIEDLEKDKRRKG